MVENSQDLTEEQSEILKRRRESFDLFFQGSMQVLAHFCDCIGLANPLLVVAEPWNYLNGVSRWIEGQDEFVFSVDEN